MSSEESAPTAPPVSGDEDSRLHIRAIKEMPAGHDEELATIFREMRRAAGVSREQIAGRLATPVDTVEALESGALFALPEWQELNRIITSYAAQLGLDSRPILRRLEGQLDANNAGAAASAPTAGGATKPGRVRSAPAGTGGPPMPPSGKTPPPPRATLPRPAKPAPPQPPGASAQARAPAPEAAPQRQWHAEETAPADIAEKPKGRAGRIARALFNWAILLGFVAALGFGVWYAATNPRAVWSTMDRLPEPIPRLMRSAWELVRPLEDNTPRTPISDPDNRKSDKLP